MNSLMHEMGAKALRLGIPLSVQLDLTYRCNERCVHCYLDHDDHGEQHGSADGRKRDPVGTLLAFVAEVERTGGGAGPELFRATTTATAAAE